MPTPSIQTLRNDAQQVLNLDSISAVRSVVAATLANANAGTPLNPNLTTQQLWNEFYQIVTQPKSDIESIIANQLMKFLFAPPAPGGAGADQQVIFNDGGVLAGDPQFLWNKTTNLLTVTGSATITGDLTVRTTGLTVNSSGVGVGVTAALGAGNIQIGAGKYLGYSATAYITPEDNVQGARIKANQVLIDATDAKFNIGGSEAMRLNAIGLGIGVASPAYRLHVQGTASLQLVLQSNDTNANAKEGTVNVRHYTNAEEPVSAVGGFTTSTANEVYLGGGFSAGNAATLLGFYTAANNTTTIGTERYRIGSDGTSTWSVGGTTAMTLNATGLGIGASPTSKLTIGTAAYAAGTLPGTSSLYSTVAQGLVVLADGFNISTRTGEDRFTLNTSGNVGIGGITPSAWAAGGNIQGTNGFIWSSYDASIGAGYYYASSSYKYISTAAASIYSPFGGTHKWFTASGGQPAGTNFTPTQAMTLDASGNLLVGKTGSNGTIGNGIINQADGAIWSTMAASTSASNTLLVYSTGIAAYRFYVSMDGTVNATNPVISAISDARLKENVQDIDVGLGAILALKPRKFDWKAGKGKDIKGDRGFIAQEFETVFPNLIDEWKDEAPEGEAPYKSVRQDLIPVLVKAIQELTARVQTLEAK